MKTISFNKKSWHYQLAALTNKYISNETTICEYLQALVAGCFLTIILTFLTWNLSIFLIEVVFTIGFSISYGHLITTPAAFGGFFLLGTALFGAFVLYFKHLFFKKVEDETSFIYTVFNKFKHKMCLKIQFKE